MGAFSQMLFPAFRSEIIANEVADYVVDGSLLRLSLGLHI